MKCIGDRFIFLPDAIRDQTSGGLWIPDSAKDIELRGEVVAVGNGETVKTLNVGDRVLCTKQGLTPIMIGDKPYARCDWVSLVCIFDSKEEELEHTDKKSELVGMH